MTETNVPSRVFARASQDAENARTAVSTPQTEDPA
ncbi:lysine decarboxylase, partial [Sphingomonas sp. ZT3P38]